MKLGTKQHLHSPMFTACGFADILCTTLSPLDGSRVLQCGAIFKSPMAQRCQNNECCKRKLSTQNAYFKKHRPACLNSKDTVPIWNSSIELFVASVTGFPPKLLLVEHGNVLAVHHLESQQIQILYFKTSCANFKMGNFPGIFLGFHVMCNKNAVLSSVSTPFLEMDRGLANDSHTLLV